MQAYQKAYQAVMLFQLQRGGLLDGVECCYFYTEAVGRRSRWVGIRTECQLHSEICNRFCERQEQKHCDAALMESVPQSSALC